MTPGTHLVVDLATLHVRAQVSATAGIWLAMGDSAFPGVGWSDFVVVLLSWWTAAILRLSRRKNATERVHFMDGPYAVKVSKSPSGGLEFRMFAGASGGREVAASEADYREFVSELVTQSRNVLNECRLREWWSPDAEVLASNLRDLEHEFAESEGRSARDAEVAEQ